MLEKIEQLLTIKQLHSHLNQQILIAQASEKQGMDLAKDVLYQVADKKTSLFLSGGRTPKDLYSVLSSDELLDVGCVGMVDERFGEKFHPQSNETMMRDAGFIRYLQMRDTPFYPILTVGKTREETSLLYDQELRSLFAVYQRTIGVLGIGLDGHTAGLPAQNSKFEIRNSKLYDAYSLVAEYNDPTGKYGERITMTFLGLSMLDLLIVLVFGDDKKEALEQMFHEGREEEIPSRFFKRPDIAAKTLLITDQNV